MVVVIHVGSTCTPKVKAQSIGFLTNNFLFEGADVFEVLASMDGLLNVPDGSYEGSIEKFNGAKKK